MTRRTLLIGMVWTARILHFRLVRYLPVTIPRVTARGKNLEVKGRMILTTVAAEMGAPQFESEP
jgi:hypothetical protein